MVLSLFDARLLDPVLNLTSTAKFDVDVKIFDVADVNANKPSRTSSLHKSMGRHCICSVPLHGSNGGVVLRCRQRGLD